MQPNSETNVKRKEKKKKRRRRGGEGEQREVCPRPVKDEKRKKRKEDKVYWREQKV